MNAVQAVEALVMAIALGLYAASLAQTLALQTKGGRVPARHARLRLMTFSAVFLGAAIFVYGAGLLLVAIPLALTGAVVFAFALALCLD